MRALPFAALRDDSLTILDSGQPSLSDDRVSLPSDHILAAQDVRGCHFFAHIPHSLDHDIHRGRVSRRHYGQGPAVRQARDGQDESARLGPLRGGHWRHRRVLLLFQGLQELTMFLQTE